MSSIFRPFQALGLVTSVIPFVIRYKPRTSEYNIVVPSDDHFHVYKLPNLALLSISDYLPSDISAFTSLGTCVYAAVGRSIYAFRGLHVSHILEGHKATIIHLLTFSNHCLVSYDEQGMLKVWDLNKRTCFYEQEYSPDIFAIAAMIHPTDYTNKILLGSVQGPLQLVNVITKKIIYWFKGFDAAVSYLAQFPDVDVCAVGLNNGSIHVHNLRYDITLIKVSQDGGPVTSIEFRSDAGGLHTSEDLCRAGIENAVDCQAKVYMLAGTASGHYVSWEVDSKGECRSIGQERELHWARILRMFCIPSGEAAGALVSSGCDNCIKVSYFDRPDGLPRTGHTRCGHFLPPNKVAFWTGGSAGGNLLLSAGTDSQLRIFSTFNERFDKSLGRAYAPGAPSRKKANSAARSQWLLPGASALSLCPARAHDWDCLAVAHTGRREVTTWNFVRATRGKHWLDASKFHGRGGQGIRLHKDTVATSLCITSCGNLVLIGYSSGDVIKFNMQSGLEYGSYGTPTAHISAVIGLHVNNVNRITITVAEKEVTFWKFKEHSFLSTHSPGEPVLFSRFHSDNDTLALALSSGEILLLNVISRKVFRRLSNPQRLTCVDMVISSNGTLVISAHKGDNLIKTWDVVDNKLVDCFRVRSQVTSLALSPGDDLLATTHKGCLGVYLWDNTSTYMRLRLQPLPVDFLPAQTEDDLRLPGVVMRNSEQALAEDDNDVAETEDSEQLAEYVSPEQLQDRLATLSGLPAAYFRAFLQLDAIKQRNRQLVMPPDDSKPDLPFFLPVVETTTGLAWIDEGLQAETAQVIGTEAPAPKPGSRKRRAATLKLNDLLGANSASILAKLPSLNLTDEICDSKMRELKSLNPSALDMEIRLLAPPYEDVMAMTSSIKSIPYDYTDALCAFLRLLLNRLRRNMDLDFVVACLETVLRLHGDVIVRGPNVSPLADDFGEALRQELTLSADTGDRSQAFRLMEEAVASMEKAQSTLFSQITRSACLTDFVRNATCTLQM